MKNKLLLSIGASLLAFTPALTVVACGKDKPQTPETNQQAIERLAREIRLHLKADWTTGDATVHSSKAFFQLMNWDTKTELTPSRLSTDLGLTVNSEVAFPSIESGFEIQFIFTKTTHKTVTGSIMEIEVSGEPTSTPVVMQLNVIDLTQAKAGEDLAKANVERDKVTVTSLGEISMAGDIPTITELKNAIKTANPSILETTDWEIQGTASATQAAVKAVVGSLQMQSATSVTITYSKEVIDQDQIDVNNIIDALPDGSGFNTKTIQQLDSVVNNYWFDAVFASALGMSSVTIPSDLNGVELLFRKTKGTVTTGEKVNYQVVITGRKNGKTKAKTYTLTSSDNAS